jgi:acetyltransferase-like isoleucine patch superfamily enzyme
LKEILMGFMAFLRWAGNKRAHVFTSLIKRDLGSIGDGSVVYPPFHSNNPQHIHIGKNTCVFWDGWLDTFPEYRSVKFDSRLDIGDNTYIGLRSHINAIGHMKIGSNVVIADGVYISDNLHGYEDVNTPVMEQPLVSAGPVVIEDDVWLGERVCVLPNVTIGRHSVIGSNSVVTKDVPPYCVAVGSPAKVIKRYDPQSGKWERV